MRTQDNSISTGAMAVLISSMLIGIGILTLPRSVTTSIGDLPDAWFSVLISGIFAMICGLLTSYLIRLFPGENIIQYGNRLLGKTVNFIVMFIIMLYFSAFVALEARALSDISKVYLLDATPVEILIALFLLTSAYAVYHGINTIVRLNLIIFPFVLLLFSIILMLDLRSFQLDAVRPVLAEGIWKPAAGIKDSIFSYLGFETLLFLSIFIKKPRHTHWAMMIGVGLPMLLYTLIVFLSVGVFSTAISTLTYPTIELAKEIEIPGAFVERFESIFMLIWIMTIFTTMNLAHYVFSLGISQLFKLKRKLWSIWPLPFFFILTLVPQDINQASAIFDYISYTGLCSITILPLVLIIIAKIKGHEVNEK